MLGPVDIDDWDFCPDDELRAEIRRLPIAFQYAADPRAAEQWLGEPLTEGLWRLSQGANFSTEALLQLLTDLITASEKLGL